MEHKAYVFDWWSFVNTLGSDLYESLRSGDLRDLITFIEDKLDLLKDPYEGERLDMSWRDMLQAKDAHEYGDFALTSFYDPTRNIGLGYEWQTIQELVDHHISNASLIVLGTPFGPESNYFDPGKMGTYFQSPSQACDNLLRVENLVQRTPDLAKPLKKLVGMLQQPVAVEQGLYVTF
jgi:hypothetical protein